MQKQSWVDPSRYVKYLHIEQSCLHLPFTQEIITRSGLEYSVIPDHHAPQIMEGGYAANLSEGKKHLVLMNNRGTFFKACPATREYRCCEYKVLNIGMNCPMDCVYCILQAYLNNPWMSFFVNTDQMIDELDEVFAQEPDEFFRIGTGEFTDSLALDRITGLSRLLVPYMADKRQAILELKSKSGVIENLAHLDHQGRTVVSWSLNSETIMQREEIRAATLDERLDAARQCSKWGYHIAFHFDPIIEHPGWQQGYARTIKKMFEAVDPEAIVWISLGALRYLPHLKTIGSQRFPKSPIFSHEFVEGLDGKARYFRSHRVALYKHLYGELRKYAAEKTCVYFCMESDEIWQEVMGFVPEEKGGLPLMLDRTVNGG